MPEHSLLRQARGENPIGSTRLPEGALSNKVDSIRHFNSMGHVAPQRQSVLIEPIMQPVGTNGGQDSSVLGVLYGPPLPVYHPDAHLDAAAKAFTAPRITSFGGTPEEEGLKARHWIGLVKMIAAMVTRNITSSQKSLIAITNMKGAAADWFFNTNDRHAELYGGQPLFDSFERFRQLFLERFGQMNTANAVMIGVLTTGPRSQKACYDVHLTPNHYTSSDSDPPRS
jgi:hypothetical protein